MSLIRLGIVALFTALWTQPVLAEQVDLAPSGNWVVDFDDDSCALLRQFGEEGQVAHMELRQYLPGHAA